MANTDLPVLTVTALNEAHVDLVGILANYSGVHSDALHVRLQAILDELHYRALKMAPLIGRTVTIKPVYLVDSAQGTGTVVAVGSGDGYWIRFPSGVENWFPAYAIEQ